MSNDSDRLHLQFLHDVIVLIIFSKQMHVGNMAQAASHKAQATSYKEDLQPGLVACDLRREIRKGRPPMRVAGVSPKILTIPPKT